MKLSATLIALCLALTWLPCGAQEAQSDFVAAFTPARLVLDPLHSYKTQELQIATAIYEGLVSYHPISLAPVPAAAERWEISDDGLVYTFHLRAEARYSNGARVTARDFRESWMRILAPEAEAEYAFLLDIIEGAADYRGARASDPQSVAIKAISDTVLEVRLTKPAGHFLSMLCHMTFMPVHEQYHGETGWDTGARIVGNGPFILAERTHQGMMLIKNPHYWDSENVKLATIRIRFIHDPIEVTRELNDGRIHWAENGDVDTLKDRETIQFYPMFGTSYLYFLSDTPPWSDARVRRGLALLLPWPAIREQSSAFSTHTLVPALTFYPDVAGIVEPDTETGLDLLAQAGYPRGAGLPRIRIKVPRGSSAEFAAHRIASTWEEALDVSVSVEAREYENYLAELKKHDYTMASATWIGDFADPLTFLQIWTTESRLNDARYMNPAFDALIDQALGEKGESRYARLSKAESLLLEEAVVLPLSHPPAFNLIDLEKVSGWYPNPLDIHPFKYFGIRSFGPPPGYA